MSDQMLLVGFVGLWLAVGVNFVLVLALIRRMVSTSPVGPMLKIGQPAPDFVARTLQGETITLANYANRRVAFIFVSAACKPCLDLLPKIEVTASSLSGVELLLVSRSDEADTRQLVDEYALSVPVVWLPDGSTFFSDYKVHATPSYCLVDESAKIQEVGLIGDDWEKIAEGWVRLSRETPTGVPPIVSEIPRRGGEQ